MAAARALIAFVLVSRPPFQLASWAPSYCSFPAMDLKQEEFE